MHNHKYGFDINELNPELGHSATPVQPVFYLLIYIIIIFRNVINGQSRNFMCCKVSEWTGIIKYALFQFMYQYTQHTTIIAGFLATTKGSET